jgi:hypothetical protein
MKAIISSIISLYTAKNKYHLPSPITIRIAFPIHISKCSESMQEFEIKKHLQPASVSLDHQAADVAKMRIYTLKTCQ